MAFKMPFVMEYVAHMPVDRTQYHAQIEPYIGGLWIVMSITILAIGFMGGYQSERGILPAIQGGIRIVKAVTMAVAVVLMIQFFIPILPASRQVMGYFWLIAMGLLIVNRMGMMVLKEWVHKNGWGGHRTIIVGTSPQAQDVGERMVIYPGLGHHCIGFLGRSRPEAIHYHLTHQFVWLGTVDTLMEQCGKHRVDTVFLVANDVDPADCYSIQNDCIQNRITLHVLGDDVMEKAFARPALFDGIPMVTIQYPNANTPSRWLKRGIDIMVSALSLMVVWPLGLVVAAWILLVSPQGPIFYKQKRVGEHGKVFDMIKFRSMIPQAEGSSGPVMVDETGDPRYIPGGKWMRQWSMDELPQLWNVLKGDMSLVGPRPERPFFVTQFSQSIPHFDRRHAVPVGITGWAQINGRSVLTRRPEHKLQYDLYYINHWSLMMDIMILIKTLGVVISRKASY
jgi:exopolysaccharide biosynthesis polyprenyl glycosylphosphotransferase